MTESRERKTVELRKYPNRRYYDSTHSCHVSLEGIYDLIREGHDVRITDSKSGEDITGRVLAQIILDHDPPKLDVFPVELLHQIIRSNEQIMRDFVDKYFNQALMSFLESQKQFNEYFRQAVGLRGDFTGSADWLRAMMGPFASPFFPGAGGMGAEGSRPPEGRAQPPGAPDPGGDGEESPAGKDEDLRAVVRELQRQVDALQQEKKDGKGT